MSAEPRETASDAPDAEPEAVSRRSELPAALDALIADGPLRVDFQPIVDLSRGTVYGFEVLGRCGPLVGPLAGMESPLRLLAVAHERGRLLDLDRRWRELAVGLVAAYPGDERFFVNVDPRVAVHPDHAPTFTRDLVRRAGLAPSRFVLELTEQPGDRATAERLLHDYRALGFGVAIDDFGAPLQSVSTVLRLKPDVLKLDAELVRGAPDDPLRRQLLRSMAQLAQDTGIVLVAEGIETGAELDTVCAAGIRFGQGYLLGRPAPRPTGLDPRLAERVRATFAHETGRGARDRDDAWSSLLRLVDAVSSERSLEALLQQVTAFSAALLGVERCTLRLLDESRRRLLVAARTGPSMHRGAGADFAVGEGLVGWVVESRRSLRVGRAETDSRFRPKPGQIGRVGSFLGVPLLDDEGCIGVLAASAPGADAFTDEDERRLRLVAGIVAPRLEMVRLRRLTVTDPLTGLWNRRALDDLVPSKGRDDEPLSVAAIDIDRFKVINDRFGHGVGDDVLRAVAVALSLAVRDSDAVVRVGGEEIVLVLRGASLELAATVAERGRGAVEALSVIDDGGVTVSIGVAEQRPGEAREDVLARADAALYRAKQSGRNRVERDDPLHWAVASKGKPYRTVVVEGYEVLVGRAAEDNDHLTFHVASPHDLWLHVAGGTPGSHVVVRNPDKTEVPRAVVEQAAAFAGWYSKARGAPRVEVHYCRASDVSKPRGAPAGLVELAKWKSVKVAPAAVPGEG